MSTHPKQEEKSSSRERGDSSDDQAADESSGSSKAEFVRQKLMVVAHYAAIGFAPVVAVIALTIAVIAVTGNRSSQTQLSELTARLDSANTSLSAAKSEMERIHIALSQLKAQQEDAHKKQEELVEKIVQDITRLQVKMKISPTLEEQLHQPASAAVAAPVASSAPVSANTPVVAPVAIEKKPSPQLKAIREAIEKFNKK